MKLTGKVAVITGAGSGIGRASAYLFSKEGAQLVVADIDDAGGEETVATITSRGAEAIFIHTDVCIASEVEHLIKSTIDVFGKIDILFNTVGIAERPTRIEDYTESLWGRIYALNVKSIMLAVKYVVPEMKKAGGGVIVNMSSMSGVRPSKLHCAYASSKGAVIMLSKALALELAPSNIRVNCIAPASTDTAFRLKYTLPEGMTEEEYNSKILSAIPLGRIARPEEIAHTALYLASNESSMVTGTCIQVDGGRGI